MTPKKSFLRIRELREKVGWTRTKLAKKADITQGTAGTYDRDAVIAPNRRVLESIAQAFGVPVAALFADYDGPSAPDGEEGE